MSIGSIKDRNSFSKKERITNKKDIDNLFKLGEIINIYPFDVRYIKVDKNIINRVLVSVAKRKVTSALKRNLIKRRVRESYRLNKKILSQLGYSIALIYSSSEILLFSKINKSVIEILNKINNK